jgi:sirohydrochlorin ferrochelatase
MGEKVFRGDGRTLLIVAHGTRTPAGVQTIHEPAAAVSVHVGPVRTAFVDVLGPNPADVRAEVSGQSTVVPAFLASAFHVRTDLPSRIGESAHCDTLVTATLRPDPELANAMHERLCDVGWHVGDAVVMAAAGSSDPTARGELRGAAALLGRLVGKAHLSYIAAGAPKVADVVAQLRGAGARRVFIAPYLLAHGLFHTRLSEAGADAVAASLRVHHRVVDLVSARFTAGMNTLAASASGGYAEQKRSPRYPCRNFTAACPTRSPASPTVAVPADLKNKGRMNL